MFAHLGMVNWRFHQVSLLLTWSEAEYGNTYLKRLTITALLLIVLVHDCGIALFACIRSGQQQGTLPCALARCGCSDTGITSVAIRHNQ